MRIRGVVVGLGVLFSAVLMFMCGTSVDASPRLSAADNSLRVGDFTLQWIHGSRGLPQTPRAIATGGVTFTIGTGTPHAIRAVLPSGRESSATSAPCPVDAFWQVGLKGRSPGMLCEGPGNLTLYLYRFNGAGEQLGSVAIPLATTGHNIHYLDAHSLGGYVLGDSVAWWLKGVGGDIVASGIASIYVPARASLPAAVLPRAGGQRFISLQGDLYIVHHVKGALRVYRLAPERVSPASQPESIYLGKVPAQRVWGVDQRGILWLTSARRGRIDLIAAVPGGNVRSWYRQGRLVGAGPGFLVFLNGRGKDTQLTVFFAEQNRSLVFRNPSKGAPFIRTAQDGSTYIYWDAPAGQQVLRVAWSAPLGANP